MSKHSLDTMRYPLGRKPGLKKDKPSAIMGRCNPVKSVVEDIPEQYWDELAASQYHQSKDTWYRYTSDQDGVGSCAAESANNTKAALDTRQGWPLVAYNPLGTYHTTSGGKDNGSVIGDNLEFGRDEGCFPEEIWPRSKGWRVKPSSEAYRIAKFFRIREFFYVENTSQFVSSLLQGYLVHAGYDGHAVSFVRYLGKGNLWFKNSWGNWGTNGFGSLKLSNIYFGYGAYAYKDAIAYYDPTTQKWGNWSDDGSFAECPWKPAMEQSKLAKAIADFAAIETRRKIDEQRPMSAGQAEDTYRKCLAKYGLAT